MKKKVAIIGAGVMGLSCAYELLKQGYAVDVYEQSGQIGGMSETFDFDGLRIEKYYHFVCGPDQPLFDLMKELGIYEKLKWTETKMGFFYQGKLYKWGDPISLLRFPKASILDKVRYGLFVFLASKRKNWQKLDKIRVLDWLSKWFGVKGYNLFWRPLFEYKFYEYKKDISAAWLWSRIRRVGLSRKNIFTEKMGYIEGSSDTLVYAIANKVKELGGAIQTGTAVERIIHDHEVKGVRVHGENKTYDTVISTIPLPYLPQLFAQLPSSLKVLETLENVAVACVILKCKRALSKNFWMNVNDTQMEIPGIIEFSNLNPLKERIIYIPFYMHREHPKYQNSDEKFIQESLQCLQRVDSSFEKTDLLGSRVFRYQYAQPVCEMGYLDKLPPIKSEIEGFYMADTSYYYPEDRSQSESIQLAQRIIKQIIQE